MALSRLMAVFLFVVALTYATCASAAPGDAPPGGKGSRVRMAGTVDSVESGVIKMSSRDGEKLTLSLGKKAKLRITGQAERSCLKSGVHVQFAALVDKKGARRFKNPVDKLLLFTPSNSLYPGLIPDPSPGAVAAAADASDLSASWKPYIVSGTFVSLDEKKLTISVPNFAPRLSVEVATKLRIEFDIDDLSVVQAGDAVRIVKGQQAGDHVTVLEATIKRRTPLENWGKKGGSPAPVARGGARAK
jgi:hypothetical protein